MACADAAEPAFATVVPFDCAIEDVLPPVLRQRAGSTDVYASSHDTDEQGVFGQGDLFFMQGAGEPAPTLRTAQAILSDTSLDAAPAAWQAGGVVSENCFALGV